MVLREIGEKAWCDRGITDRPNTKPCGLNKVADHGTEARVAPRLQFRPQLFLPGVGWFGRDGANTGILGSLWGTRERVPPFLFVPDSIRWISEDREKL